MKSTSIGELSKALTQFQSEVTSVPQQSVNPFFKSKYADLATIVEHCKKPLAKNGLSISQVLNEKEDCASVTTILMHSSGEWIDSTVNLKPSKNDPQGIGSAITYGRRYGYSAILGIATEEDEDGNTATHDKPKEASPKAKEYAKELREALSDKHIKDIWSAIELSTGAKELTTFEFQTLKSIKETALKTVKG